MAIEILGEDGTTVLKVDSTSNAGRVTLYDQYGNPMSDVSSLSNVLNALNDEVKVTLGGQSTVGFDVESTSGTLTLSFEATINNVNWFAISVTPVAGGATVTTTTANGQWVAAVGGYFAVRVRISAFTSGSMTVSVVVTPGPTASITQAVSGTVTAAQATAANLNATVVQGSGSGSAATFWTVRLSDGTAFYNAPSAGQLPAALVGGRLDTNVGAWLGSTAPTVGSKTSANSIPVVIANDQGTFTVFIGAGAATIGKVDQGAPNTLANKWPVQVTDGTNSMPTADVAARALFEKITDGTNTSAVKAASTAAQTTDPALVVALSPNNTPFQFSGDDRLRVGQETLLFYDSVEGASVNTNLWVQSQTGMTQTQGTGILTLNAGSSTTSGNFSILTSNKQFRQFSEFPNYVQFRARLVQPGANSVQEIGFLNPSGVAAPTDGVFLRVDATGALKGVINFNGTETTTAALTAISSANFFNFEITVFEDHVEFEITSPDLSVNIEVSLNIPATQGSPMSVSHISVSARVYNSGIPASAPQIILASVNVQQMDVVMAKPWAEQLAGTSLNAMSDPSTFAQAANYANSAAPTSATLSNTAAGYTTLGGLWQFAAVAGAETDYALFAYQVPTGFQLYVTELRIEAFTMGATTSGTTVLQWGLATNSSAVSLATAGASPPLRAGLGAQSMAKSAAIGTSFDEDITVVPVVPWLVESAKFLHIILRIPVGTATAGLIIRGSVNIAGYFE